MAVAGRNLTGRVAQLGSALPWHGRGPEFKSRHVHQIYTPITSHADTLSSIKNTDIKNIPTLSKQVTKYKTGFISKLFTTFKVNVEYAELIVWQKGRVIFCEISSF